MIRTRPLLLAIVLLLGLIPQVAVASSHLDAVDPGAQGLSLAATGLSETSAPAPTSAPTDKPKSTKVPTPVPTSQPTATSVPPPTPVPTPVPSPTSPPVNTAVPTAVPTNPPTVGTATSVPTNPPAVETGTPVPTNAPTDEPSTPVPTNPTDVPSTPVATGLPTNAAPTSSPTASSALPLAPVSTQTAVPSTPVSTPAANKITPTITWDNPADITYGTALSAIQLDAKASVPGSFSYSPAAGTVLGAGSNQALSTTFTPADTTKYNPVNKSVTINVAKGDTTTTITSDLSAETDAGDSYTVSYTVTAASGTPTGDVTVSDGSASCTAPVSAGGCSLASTSVGTKTLTATYSGDGNHGGSTSGGLSHQVDKAKSETLLTSSENPSALGEPVTFTAVVQGITLSRVTPTGDVEFFDSVQDNNGNYSEPVSMGKQPLDGSGKATLTTASLLAGHHHITAVYSGDTLFQSSTSNECPQLVKPTTLAVIASLDAYVEDGKVYVQWETASETGTAGFYLYRADGSSGQFLPVNQDLVPALYLSPRGGSYRVVDPGARPGGTYIYRLVELEHTGGRITNGPYTVTVAPGQGAAAQLAP